MSVREYIGARYVPVFADPIQWDPTSVYEPLTVVTNQGASYVSRRMVPEGILLSNTDYWVLWADFNAQLQHYIDEVETFDGRIDALEDALPIADFSSQNTVSDKFPIATADIADGAVTSAKIASGAVETADIADSAVTSAKIASGAITSAKIATGAIKPAMLNTGKMVVIGDSYSALTNNTREQSWWYLLSQILNVDPYSYAVNGTAFVKQTPSPNFLAQLHLAGDDTAFDNDDVTWVFIYGGYNDCYDSSGIGGSAVWSAVRDCLIYAKATFPNAKIVVAGCNTNKNLYVHDSSHWNQAIYAEIMANAVNTQYGAIFLDLTQLFVGEYDFIDNVTDHPNLAGQKAIAQAMLNGIYGNNPYTNMNTIIDITSQVTNGSAGAVQLIKHGGKWGMNATGVRGGSNGMIKFTIPHNIWTMLPDNIPCICDSSTGTVTYGAVLAGDTAFNGFANQNANCFITWNIEQKNAYRAIGASHNYTIT